MSDAITEGDYLGHVSNMYEMTLDRTYYLSKEGYKVTTNLLVRAIATKMPKATFNDKWSVPIVSGFTTDLKYKQLDLLLSENDTSLTHFFNEQRVLRQQYELLKLLEN